MKKKGNDHSTRSKYIQFVRQDESTADTRTTRSTLFLDRGELRMDLNRKLFFYNIVETSWKNRPDVVLQQSKTLVAVKLIVPWEESWKEAHERKSFSWEIARAKDDALGCFLLRVVAEGSQRCESWP